MRKLKENLLKSLIYLSAFFTVSMLVVIVGYIFIKGIGGVNLSFLTSDYSADGSGGILPMIVTTVYTVILSIAIATPIGILSAIYLQEYAKKGKLVNAIRFATESLAGIPSIIYGLFGGIFFVVVLNLKYSILSGALTVAIIILPVIIRTTEEALKTVPDGYREASLALGLLLGVILSVGRVVGESAAILLTAGTVAQMPGGIFDSARNLTVHAYLLTKEKGDIASAASIGIVLIFIVLFLNTVAKFVAKKLNKANY